ncbi:MAG: hypothetical protein OEU91_09380 [Gammaproteobacteria bacterium]|nr:hypothetical protein [Gammaproteobacteria bacterium]
MKKFIMTMMGVTGLAFSGLALANGDGLGIIGSPHDFSDDFSDEVGGAVLELGSSGGWNGRNELCRVCHVPHDHSRASQRYLNGLLWNHELSAATYTMYDSVWSSTLEGSQSAQPDGVAKLCLGCHDGTIAIDTFDKYAGDPVNNNITTIYGGGVSAFVVPGFTDGANLDLRGTHPLSITYDPVADSPTGANLNPTSTVMGASGTIADVLDNGKVQCSSCHDVHNQESVGGTHLLRVAQKDMGGGEQPSGLCLTCHNK